MKNKIKQIIREVLEDYGGSPYLDMNSFVKNGFSLSEDEIRDSQILSDTRCLINEEQGINDEVAKATRYIISNIDGWLENGTTKIVNGIPLTHTAIQTEMFNENIKIEINLFDLTRNNRRIVKTRSFYDENASTIKIDLKRVDGKIDYNNFYEIIQHEVNHCFQNAVRGGKHILRDDKDTLYKFVCKNMLNSSNSVVQKIGIIIYISFRFEQESFGNGLYSLLTHNLDKNWEQMYCESEIYQYICFLKESLNFIDDANNAREINSVLMELRMRKLDNVTKNELRKMCYKTYYDLINRAGKVISLVKDKYGLTESKIWY